MKKTLPLIVLLCLLTTFASAETYNGCDADAISNGAETILTNDKNGTIKFIKLEEAIYMHTQGMKAWLKELLDANDKTGFRLYETKTDKLGYTHYRFRQTHDGYDVNSGVYYIHTLNGQIISANGEFYPNIELNVSPVITVEGAIAIGKEYIHSHNWAWEEDRFPTPEIFVQLGEDGYHLTYKTDIYSVKPLDRKYLMIDVVSGDIVAEFNRIHTSSVPGEAHCKYHGIQSIIVDSIAPNQFRLRDDTRGGGIETYDMNEGTDYNSAVDFTDTDNVWTTTTNDDDAALDAHWGAENFYDYMLDVHGHDSFDGNGSTIRSYIHFDNSYVNAFWDGQRMTYGDGDGVDYSPLTSVDVVGHEIMHGITQFTANLIYAGESGGLNESYSDIFGVVLDYQINPLTANFLMGDEFTATPFRDMANPNDYGNPSTYDGLFWGNSGVHSWSGIQNYFFYLLTQGGSGTNDNDDDYDVTAISMEDGASIVWRSLSVYMTESTTMADARFFGIQSAEELFGNCTQQEVSVTNGWYAVGIGEPFVEGVVADFSTSGNFNCQVPAAVQFTNTSVNAVTYLWNFGNGTTSVEENPIANYSMAGEYTVTLTATSAGTGLCAGTNTIVLTNLITVASNGGPIAPSCLPSTNFATNFTGVFDFNFATINNPTNGSQEGYQDYTCTYSAVVTEALFYPFTAITGTTEAMRIWIDSDDNGEFDEVNELVYVSPGASASQQGDVFIPTPSQYDVPLRMRIKSDVSTNPNLPTPCGNPQNGQVEDYTISISQNTMPPATNFVASQTLVVVGSTIDFTDLTENLPNNWTWSFSGGSPSTSSATNPSIQYNTVGTYPVSLMTTNSFGQSSEVKVGYVTVVPNVNNCAIAFSNAESGTYYDSGGAGENYGDSEFCDLLVAPNGCVKDVTMDFSSFVLESGDNIKIYDGDDFNDPLIGSYSGTNSPGTVTATSGKMFLRFSSDFSLNNFGWQATWTSSVSDGPPTANFSASSLSVPVNGSVDFTDLSTEFPTEWSWEFGDGGTSIEQNPSYVYITPGMYTVQLTVTNCFSTDVYTIMIEVQDAPAVSVNPGSINIDLECGETRTVNVTVSNSGAGDLIFDFEGGERLDNVRQRLNNDFESLTDLMPNFHPITEGVTGNLIGDGGGDMYDGGNMLSIDASGSLQYSNDVIVPNSNLGTGGQYFTNKYPGLFVLAADINNVDMFSINGTLGSDGNGNVNAAQLTVNHEGANYTGFVKRVWDAFDPSINHLIIVKEDPALVQTVPTTTNTDDHDISGLSGTTRIYYLLFAEASSGYYNDAQITAIMTQFLEIAELTSMEITTPPGPHVITGGNSETYPITFLADGLSSGVYTTNITIASNDPSLTSLQIPVTMTVTGMSVDFNISGGSTAGVPFNFQSSSSSATSWFWNFGDGGTSNLENPSHVYQNGNTYNVTLTVFNDAGCSATITLPLDVMTDVEELDGEISLYPNPSDGNIYIKNTSDEAFYEIRVVNAIGQLVKLIDTSAHSGDVYHLLLDGFAPGVYVLELKFGDNQVLQRKFVLQTER